MPEEDKQNFFYQDLFPSGSNGIRQRMANIEIARARQDAITYLEAYEEEIKKIQEKKEKIEASLKKGGLSPNIQDAALKRLEELNIELATCQSKFNSWIESDSELKSYFASRAH